LLLAHLQLHVADNFDAQGGVLFAQSPNILAAERPKTALEPVPYTPVMPARRDTA
jgi:hypothetical protein